jgi:hypothetical protein
MRMKIFENLHELGLKGGDFRHGGHGRSLGSQALDWSRGAGARFEITLFFDPGFLKIDQVSNTPLPNRPKIERGREEKTFG